MFFKVFFGYIVFLVTYIYIYKLYKYNMLVFAMCVCAKCQTVTTSTFGLFPSANNSNQPDFNK